MEEGVPDGHYEVDAGEELFGVCATQYVVEEDVVAAVGFGMDQVLDAHGGDYRLYIKI
jgi:hypothetical protein